MDAPDRMSFSRYISNPSTTTATSETTAPSDLDPPAFAPPPPPPLNIPPSRARRQLAARLALHQKQQDTSNGDDATDKDPDAIEAAANPNPFADTDSDDELTIENVSGAAVETSAWDMDGPEEGKVIVEEGFEDNFGDGVDAVRALQVSGDSGSKAVGSTEEVGNGEPATTAASGEQETDSASRSSNFSGMWPFNHASRGHRRRSVGERYGRKEEGNDFFGESDSDSDEGFDGIGEREASGDFDSRGRKPSGTTEARRRTSLDDEEVVEVGRGEGGDGGAVGGGKEGDEKVA
ncbi:hypothetical protein VE03_04462 [Pseudogymnoascus sp. 23342-1-I1]|nr:hypothetical protein VE03_04462 [Pseudogymnoascus sp. 23342-1-I1]